MKILIVEDEFELQQAMRLSLEKAHYMIEVASTCFEASDKMLNYEYDCILLDIMLPDGNGIELLAELRNNMKLVPVIIISAKDSVDDKVKGLNLGADDYLTKPFHLAELHARVKAAVRRKMQDGKDALIWKNLQLNPTKRVVLVDNVELLLNRKEFDLLYYFIVNPERLISRTSIAEYVWGDHADQVDNLDFIYSQIKNLRKKLKDAKAELDILSVYGMGYKMS